MSTFVSRPFRDCFFSSRACHRMVAGALRVNRRERSRRQRRRGSETPRSPSPAKKQIRSVAQPRTTKEDITYPTVQSGTYEVKATKEGFRPIVEGNIPVTINTVARVDFHNAGWQRSETIEVSSQAQTLKPIAPKSGPKSPPRLLPTFRCLGSEIIRRCS